MPSTPTYGLPYAALTDPPNGAAQQQALAEATESSLSNVESALQGQIDARAIGVRLENSSTQAIASATDTLVDFSTEDFVRNGVSVNAALNVVTIDEDGLYHLSAGCRFTGSTGENSIVITEGTATVSNGVYAQNGSAGGPDVSCGTVAPLAVGDQVAAAVYSANGHDVGPGAGRVTYLAVFKIGNL